MTDSREIAFKRGLAIGLSLPQMSISSISDQTGVPISTIYRWISEYKEGKRLPSKKPGRPKKTTPRSNRLLCRLAINNHVSSAAQLHRQWGENVSLHTIYRRLRSSGIKRRRRAMVPFLTPANITARLQWCMARSLWREVWNRVIFTDESRFRRFWNDGRVRVWRRKGERFHKKNVTCLLQAGGGSVHVWGAIWRGGRSRLVVLTGVVNQQSYIETLQDFFNETELPENAIFQRDNAPAHTAAGVQQFLDGAGVRVLPWPSRSPDLNPIEHVWDAISRNINSRPHPAETIEQLRAWIQYEWHNLSQDFIDGLILSLPRRLVAVIEAHGRQTKY